MSNKSEEKFYITLLPKVCKGNFRHSNKGTVSFLSISFLISIVF